MSNSGQRILMFILRLSIIPGVIIAIVLAIRSCPSVTLDSSDVGSYDIVQLGSADPVIRDRALRDLSVLGAQAVPALVRGLGSQNPEIRRACARQLGELLPPVDPALPALVERLADTDPAVADAARHALAKIGTVAVLVEALQSADPRIRRGAATVLVRLENVNLKDPGETAAATEALRAAVTDVEPSVRNAAAITLAMRYGDSATALPVLRDALQDDSEEVRRTAARLLVASGESGATVLREATEANNSEAASAAALVLARNKAPLDAILPALIEASRRPEWIVREDAVKRIGELVRAELIGLDLWGIEKGESNAREEAAVKLARSSETIERASVPLRAAMEDPDARVRSAAAYSLGTTLRALRSKVESFEHADPRRSPPEWATRSARRLADVLQANLAALKVSVTDPDPHVGGVTINALGKSGTRGKEAVPQLIQALKDPKRRIEAVDALGKMHQEALSAVEPLTALLEDPDAFTRSNVAIALKNISRTTPEEATSSTIATVEKRRLAIKEQVAHIALYAILGRTDDSDHDARIARLDAALWIGGAENPKVIEAIERAIRDSDVEVKRRIFPVLGSYLHSNPTPPGLIQLMAVGLVDSDPQTRRFTSNAFREIYWENNRLEELVAALQNLHRGRSVDSNPEEIKVFEHMAAAVEVSANPELSRRVEQILHQFADRHR